MVPLWLRPRCRRNQGVPFFPLQRAAVTDASTVVPQPLIHSLPVQRHCHLLHAREYSHFQLFLDELNHRDELNLRQLYPTPLRISPESRFSSKSTAPTVGTNATRTTLPALAGKIQLESGMRREIVRGQSRCRAGGPGKHAVHQRLEPIKSSGPRW